MVIWTGERHRQQGRLVAEMYQAAAGVPCERSAAIAGGLPGADKAAALDQSGVDRSRYLTVSIDAVLDRMAAAGLITESDGLSRWRGRAWFTPRPSIWPNGSGCGP